MAERRKMTMEERAKQFAPFAALKGYEEMIERAGVVVAERKTLTDERAEALSQTVAQLKKGDMIKVVYYSDGKYVTSTGILSRLDETTRVLFVVKTKIKFDDIYDIEKV